MAAKREHTTIWEICIWWSSEQQKWGKWPSVCKAGETVWGPKSDGQIKFNSLITAQFYWYWYFTNFFPHYPKITFLSATTRYSNSKISSATKLDRAGRLYVFKEPGKRKIYFKALILYRRCFPCFSFALFISLGCFFLSPGIIFSMFLTLLPWLLRLCRRRPFAHGWVRKIV